MIANNENGRPPFDGTPVVIATAGRGAVNHSEQDTPPAVTWEVVMLHGADDFARHVLPMGATPYAATDRLICPCNDGPSMCPECRAAATETDLLSRLRRLREAEDGATDGEARDYPEDVT